MHITYTPVPGADPMLGCSWCGGSAVDPEVHTRWHWRNEGRGPGDASATGTSSGSVRPGATWTVLRPVVAMYADDARTALEAQQAGYGAVISEEQAVEMGLLPGLPPPPDDARFGPQPLTDSRTGLRRDPPSFPAPVHAVPVTGSSAPDYFKAVDDWLYELREVARNRARAKHGDAVTVGDWIRELEAMLPEVEQQSDRARSEALDADLIRETARRETEQALRRAGWESAPE